MCASDDKYGVAGKFASGGNELFNVFHEYIFVDEDFVIMHAGDFIMEWLKPGKPLAGSHFQDLLWSPAYISKLHLQVAGGNLEWRTYEMSGGNGDKLEVEICAVKIDTSPRRTIVLQFRETRNCIKALKSLEAVKVSFWVASALHQPVISIKGYLEELSITNSSNRDVQLTAIKTKIAQLNRRIEMMTAVARQFLNEG